MKYVIMLGDGMADYKVDELGGKTPLDVAHKPNMDFLAQHGMVGMVRTVPEGMAPGSDPANLSVMGYDPQIYYSGRSPLEAVSMGIDLAADDVTFRCNLVTVTPDGAYEDATMIDYSSGEISSEEAAELIDFLNKNLRTDERFWQAGVSYRHCMVLHHAKTGSVLTPPHDITGQPVAGHLPGGTYGAYLLDLMKKSRELLREHPVNLARMAQGKNPANSCWFWGEGTKPRLSPFKEMFGVTGGVVSAVDLIKGIGLCAGMKVVDVPGATGNNNTNFAGKAQAALDILKDNDLVYIHVEAPDECGHQYLIQGKVESIELIDREILGRVIPALQAGDEPFSVLLAPDHPTPLALRTHVGDPVPFVLYRSDRDSAYSCPSYNEDAGKSTGIFVPKGAMLMPRLVNGDFEKLV